MTFGMYGPLRSTLIPGVHAGSSPTLARARVPPMSVTFFVVSPGAGRAVAPGPPNLISVGMCLTGGGLVHARRRLATIGLRGDCRCPARGGAGPRPHHRPDRNRRRRQRAVARSGHVLGLVNVGRMVGATLGVAILGILFGAHIAETASVARRFPQGRCAPPSSSAASPASFAGL